MKNPEFRVAFERSSQQIKAIDEVVRALEAQRELHDISKAELARRAGLPAEAVRRLFTSGRANPTLATVAAIANALEVELVLQPRSVHSTTVRRVKNSSRNPTIAA
jgi:DNA-binding phage protein